MSVELPLQTLLRDMHRAAVDEVNCWRGKCVDHFAQIEACMTAAVTAMIAHSDGSKIKRPVLFGGSVSTLKDAVTGKGPFVALGKDLRAALTLSDPVFAQRNLMIHATGRVFIEERGSWVWLHQYQPTGKTLERGFVTEDEASDREKMIRSARDRLRTRIDQFVVRLNEQGAATAKPTA